MSAARVAGLLLAALLAAAPAGAAGPFTVVLGTAQDGGVPQAGCTKACCAHGRHEAVSSLALVDPASRQWWWFDATPDAGEQLARLRALAPTCTLAGVFVTHAHIGHYTGLMHFGREVMGTHDMPVWAMPRLRDYLATNGPWSQLVRLRNIVLQPLAADSTVTLGDSLRVTPFRVPHRDEYSETVGFRIEGPRGVTVYLPDIDKWERWDRSIDDVIADATTAYLDGTFFDAAELPGRDMREIPHPFIVESLARFATLPPAARARVRFIHLNHTNRAALAGSRERRQVEAAGAHVAVTGEQREL
ncbi:MAG: MBL fold metallo-hydrolase [Candidatus Eisenbacteria bacterium]